MTTISQPQPHAQSTHPKTLTLIIPRQSVKHVKTALEADRLLDKNRKIRVFSADASHRVAYYRVTSDDPGSGSATGTGIWNKVQTKSGLIEGGGEGEGRADRREEGWYCIPTLLSTSVISEGDDDDEAEGERVCVEAHNYDCDDEKEEEEEDFTQKALAKAPASLCRKLCSVAEIGILSGLTPYAEHDDHDDFNRSRKPDNHILENVVNDWFDFVSSGRTREFAELSYFKNGTMRRILPDHGSHYSVYYPMLLLHWSFFKEKVLDRCTDLHLQQLSLLCSKLCHLFDISHVAVNGSIPLQLKPQDVTDRSGQAETTHLNANILRSPTNFTILHGNFGPDLPAEHEPTDVDFKEAFWCSAVQNSVHQVWAPRYTMFSKGNTSEKARIQGLPSLTRLALGCDADQTSAVDLYAGIGYFVFSYVRRGVGKVLCWEINEWSVEGMKRGAEANGWDSAVLRESLADREALRASCGGNQRIMIFPESNENVVRRIDAIRDLVPPIRHINCGYLPSSAQIWKSAVEALDPVLGGWIHAHENMGKKQIESRQKEIVHIFSTLVLEIRGSDPKRRFSVACEHVERVKSYSPGVIHCVLDIAIKPSVT